MSDLATTAASYTVRDLFQRAFNIYGPRIAVTAEAGQWTYAEIGEQARRLAAALHGLGLRQGERVAVLAGRPDR